LAGSLPRAALRQDVATMELARTVLSA